MNSLIKLVVTSVAVTTMACAVSVMLIPPPEEEARERREREAEALVTRISEELWNYQRDHGSFPPGDGKGSADLAKALLAPRTGGVAYISFGTKELSEEGDIINPATLQRTIIHYRNNRNSRPGEYQGHNPLTFDLWCQDAKGRPGGVNNWE